MIILKSVSEVKKSENGNEYYQIGVQSDNFGSKIRKRNVFANLDKDSGEITWDWTREEAAASIGKELKGVRVITSEVEGFEVEGKTYYSATVVAFSEETDAQALKRNGFTATAVAVVATTEEV